MTPGDREKRSQTGTLRPHGILCDLNEDRLTRFQNGLDARRFLPFFSGDSDLPRVEDTVARLADIDERRLHPRQHVLNSPEIDVSDQRAVVRAGDIVLDDLRLFENGYLGPARIGMYEHGALSLGRRRPLRAPAPGPFAPRV